MEYYNLLIKTEKAEISAKIEKKENIPLDDLIKTLFDADKIFNAYVNEEKKLVISETV